jgi:hypothetical protein
MALLIRYVNQTYAIGIAYQAILLVCLNFYAIIVIRALSPFQGIAYLMRYKWNTESLIVTIITAKYTAYVIIINKNRGCSDLNNILTQRSIYSVYTSLSLSLSILYTIEVLYSIIYYTSLYSV